MVVMPRMLLAQQGSDAKVPAEDFRLNLGALLTPASGTAIAALSGVVAGSGAGGMGCDVTATGASTLSVAPGNFVLQRSTTNGGAYIGTIDAATVVTLTGLPGAGQYKAGYVLAHVYDEAYGDSQDGFALEFALGSAASTPAGAAYPAVPANNLVLAGFTVDSAGTITLVSSAVRTVARGGINPVVAGDTLGGDYAGQWRDEPNLGLQRWSGSAWLRPHAIQWGSGTTFPPNAQVGDMFVHTGLGCTMRYVGSNGWRQADLAVVANGGARNSISTSYSSVLHQGFTVWQSDVTCEFVWDGTKWSKVPGLPVLMYSNPDSGASGSFGANSNAIGVINNLPAIPAGHQPGVVRVALECEVAMSTTASTAGFLQLWYGPRGGSPTASFTERVRFHNNGVTNLLSRHIEGTFYSDGSADQSLWLIGWNDPLSSGTVAIAYNTWQVWLL